MQRGAYQHPSGEETVGELNERLERWQRRAEILESENRQLRTVLGQSFHDGRQLQLVLSPPLKQFFTCYESNAAR